MQYQWYPGHMTKAKRMMQENIKLVDLIIELVDARIPYSSRNPDIDELGRNKARLILLNKADLADEAANAAWTKALEATGAVVVKANSRSGAGLKAVQGAVAEACKEKIERDRRRGIKNRPVRAMVAGIPNVGKSTFINKVAGRKTAKAEDRPGVTRGKQWIAVDRQLELLDTPGILWPRFENQEVGFRLALIGSIRDEVLNTEEMAFTFLQFLRANYPGLLQQRYEIEESDDALENLNLIAENRLCRLKGNMLDLKKASDIVIDDFRSGRLGRITLEFPDRVGQEKD